MNQLDRITQQPEVMGGRACIRGMRVTVGMIVAQIGAGRSVEDVLVDYPYLEREDIMQALRYAAWRAEERDVTLASAAGKLPLRELLLAGASSAPTGPVGPTYFNGLRDRCGGK